MAEFRMAILIPICFVVCMMTVVAGDPTDTYVRPPAGLCKIREHILATQTKESSTAPEQVLPVGPFRKSRNRMLRG